jgi:hypothetical protein
MKKFFGQNRLRSSGILADLARAITPEENLRLLGSGPFAIELGRREREGEHSHV